MMTATNIHYERADRVRGLSAGGIGAILLLAQKIELDKEIDRTLHLLKRHLPYHESDHVLNIAFNADFHGRKNNQSWDDCRSQRYVNSIAR